MPPPPQLFPRKRHMSVRLTPSPDTPPQFVGAHPFGPYTNAPSWPEPPAQPEEPEGVQWGRYLDVLKRHFLLILVLFTAGSAVGLWAARRVRPIYETQATIWINGGRGQQGGSIGSQQLLEQTSWVELLRSFAVVDAVVRDLNLNVFYKVPGDSVLFRTFHSGASLLPGLYALQVAPSGKEYTVANATGAVVDRGAVGDSVGRSLGFSWQPDAALLTPGKLVTFSVTTPRNVSLGLLGAMRSTLPEDGQFLKISLSGSNPKRSARTVNAWAEQFVTSAIDLKKHHLLEFKQMVGDQLAVAERELGESEVLLERFRASTITLPSGGSPLASAAQASSDPAFSTYFQQKATLEEVRNDRANVERIIAEARGGPINPQAFLQLPGILNNTPQLRTSIDELSSRQAALRTEQQYLTDANPRIKQLNEAIRVIEYETIPRIAQSVLASLRVRENQLTGRIGTQESVLRQIPSRSIEEMRLVRRVSASETMYNSLKARYEEISLAEAQTTPDLSILDYAIAPVRPTSNDAQRLLLLAILASVALACAIALIRDRFDRLFRYPQEATGELGLMIAGTVPRFKPDRSGDFQLLTLSQAVESFRSLHLAVRYDFPGGGPIAVSVASPGPGDGKSLVSSNLAIAFASAGHRTLLIDGDVRRGNQGKTFSVAATPGLVEYLQGAAGRDDVISSTSFPNLFLLPAGSRRSRAPELLVSDRMNALLHGARQDFEVIIIDSPPFIAGVDAYALAAAAGSMLVVLRPGVSDRKLAAAKLQILDRLPIRVLGAVLNGVPQGGAYRYYGTDYYGEGRTKDHIGNLATPKGILLNA
jgi:succinoglycan biosynthesis transport protein ExoP